MRRDDGRPRDHGGCSAVSDAPRTGALGQDHQFFFAPRPWPTGSGRVPLFGACESG